MSISGRKHIRWFPEERAQEGWVEPTSTLVLTSKKDNYYIDIRVSDNTVPPRTGLPDLFPAPPSPVSTGTQKPSYFTSVIEWAFAGQSESVQDKDEKGKPVRTTTWHHWIDSQNEEDFEDKGSMWEAGENMTLEKGRMLNPSSGKIEQYEEMWREIPIEIIPKFSSGITTPSTASKSSHRAASGDGSHSASSSQKSLQKGKISMVLRGENEALGIRGLVIRVGGWVQGIIKTSKDTSAERWMYTQTDGDKSGWHQIVKYGTVSLPCRTLWEKEDMQVGDEILSGGMKWEVVEKEVWE